MFRMFALVMVIMAASDAAHAGLMDKIKSYKEDFQGKKDKTAAPADAQGGAAKDEKTVADGLKEALTVGTKKAVEAVARPDGYFGNPKIRIPLPEKVQKVEGTLRKIGLKKQMDEFHVTMNRAAEKAAPVATDIFIGAVREMTILDALKILQGGDTAATEYFRSRTYERLYTAFKPPVAKAVSDVGVTKAYQQLVDKAKKARIIKDESMDLDHHVTSKALDGLFYMVGEEERKIRKDPVARVTDLLKKVFGK